MATVLEKREIKVGRARKPVTECLVKLNGWGYEFNRWVRELDLADDLIDEFEVYMAKKRPANDDV